MKKRENIENFTMILRISHGKVRKHCKVTVILGISHEKVKNTVKLQ